MAEVKIKHQYFNINDIFNFINCHDCSSFRSYPATQFEPSEQACLDGDFGNDHPCCEMLGAVERLIDDGYLSNDSSYIAPHSYCADNELFEPEEGWSAHEYWWVFYDETEPEGYDTLDEIYRECFV